MKRVTATFLCAAMMIALVPVPSSSAPLAAAKAARQTNGVISGTAMMTVDGKEVPAANLTARLRDIDRTGNNIVSEQRTTGTGAYNFTGLGVGNYIVEIVDDQGRVVATTAKVGLVVGAMVASNVLAGSGAAAGAAAAGVAAGGGAFLATTAGIVTAVAVGAGVTAAVVAATNDASASGGLRIR